MTAATRPVYTVPASTPAPVAALLLAAAERKAVLVDADGAAFWLQPAHAAAIAARHGGTVFPPIA